MKTIAFTFISTIVFLSASAQSKLLEEVFRLLPADKLFNLTIETRDSMLMGKTYYPADNDSNSIQAYNYGISTYVNDYMYVSMHFETAQRGSGMIEIRSFKTTKGENLIVVSESGGVTGINYQQNDLSSFTYDAQKRLRLYENNLFPLIDESIFMKTGIPDSIKKTILDNSNMSFNFSTEKPILELNSDYLTSNKTVKKWLKGDFVEFKWTGDKFIIDAIGFE